MPAKKTPRRIRRLGPDHARDLERTIALVTAMARNLDSGDTLTVEQVAACFHDRTLGILWARIWDYAEYVSRSQRLRHIAFTDECSIGVAQHLAQFNHEVDLWLRYKTSQMAPCVDEVRRQALLDGGLMPPPEPVQDKGRRAARAESLTA